MKKAHAALTLIIFVSSLAIAEPINLKQSSFLWRQMADIKEGLRGYQQLFSGKQLDEQQKKAIRNLTIKTGAFIAALASAAGLSYLGYKKLTSPTLIPLTVGDETKFLAIPEREGETNEVILQDSDCIIHIKMSYSLPVGQNKPTITSTRTLKGSCDDKILNNIVSTIEKALPKKFKNGLFILKNSNGDITRRTSW